MRIGAFEIDEPLPRLRDPHALAMLHPWVNVGDVGSLVLSHFETHLQSHELGRLARPGDFFDFSRYRPVIYLQGNERQITVPNTRIAYATGKGGHDFLFLHLLEPHSHGETYVESLLQVLAQLGAKRYCLVGSMYDLVPHTRPLLVTGAALGETAQREVQQMGLQPSGYQGPTTILYLVSQSAVSLGMETMSVIVHLPQYTELEEDYAGAVRLVQVLGSLYGLPGDQTYADKAAQQLEQVNALVERDPHLKSIVQQLEASLDARKQKQDEGPGLSPEVEKFLREMDKRFREG